MIEGRKQGRKWRQALPLRRDYNSGYSKVIHDSRGKHEKSPNVYEENGLRREQNMLTIEQPLLLLMFVPIGILIYLTWKRMALPYPAFQRRLILVCRLLLFSFIILALAGTAWTQAVHR